MQRPATTEYAPFYATYVNLVTEDDTVAALATQLDEVTALLQPVSEAEGNVAHSPYTWTVKEVVGHMTDGERVFGYRALRFGRNDPTPLPGFEENGFASAAEFNRIPLADLVAEFAAVRRANLYLLRHMPAAAEGRGGVASDNFVTVRALAAMMLGHVRHHTNILKKRLQAGAKT